MLEKYLGYFALFYGSDHAVFHSAGIVSELCEEYFFQENRSDDYLLSLFYFHDRVRGDY